MADLMDKIDVLKLKEILEEKEMKFTREDITAIMDAELEKTPAEMNTNLVDICAAALTEGIPAQEEATEPKSAKRKVTVGKILLIAAVFMLGFVVALPVGAKLFNSNSSNGIIGFYSDFFKIDLNKDKPTSAETPTNEAVIDADNLDSFMLPEALLGDEYKKDVQIEEDEHITTALISLDNTQQKISGLITVTQYKDTGHDMTNGKVNVPYETYRNIKNFTIDNIEIIVFGEGKESYINYCKGNTNYQISLNCDFDTMVSIAETINVKG